jgi:mRNA-degrading endonuclease HigB of HigAB toxin-antitoxin module
MPQKKMDITKEHIERAINVWQYCKTGRASTKQAKTELITLYNEIHKTNYKTTSNCSSCLNTCYQGIKRIVEKYAS